MLFNSLSFLLFFIFVSSLYFALPHRFRWMLLLAASCFFYMCFIPIYILILAGTIGVDYVAGILIEGTLDPGRKKAYLMMSIASVCAILFFFKYFNFFNNNVAALARVLHWNYPMKTLRLILPIGLSFHTFQSLSYVFEVYRGRQRAEKHFGLYSLYVMYFPQLVAGPIERPQNLLHQFKQVKQFDWQRLWNGASLSLWGLFKKVVVADSLAIYTDTIYNNSRQHTGTSLLVATYFFAIQIYCDFSGYSDIARGISRIYGIELMKNFETPYFAKSISEFWSRWHISLSTWFRDYVYIPLGGNRVSLSRNMFNISVVFLISGLWHGANWTFVIWGALHGFYYLVWRSVESTSARKTATQKQRRDDLELAPVSLSLSDAHLINPVRGGAVALQASVAELGGLRSVTNVPRAQVSEQSQVTRNETAEHKQYLNELALVSLPASQSHLSGPVQAQGDYAVQLNVGELGSLNRVGGANPNAETVPLIVTASPGTHSKSVLPRTDPSRIPLGTQVATVVASEGTVRASRARQSLRDGFLILLTFHLVLLSWVFFRAANVSTAVDTLRRIAVDHGPLFWDPILVQGGLAILLLVALDVFHRRTGFWDALDRLPRRFRLAYALALLFGIVLFGVDTGTQFIYFQF